jgi:hypothetical protein
MVERSIVYTIAYQAGNTRKIFQYGAALDPYIEIFKRVIYERETWGLRGDIVFNSVGIVN